VRVGYAAFFAFRLDSAWLQVLPLNVLQSANTFLALNQSEYLTLNLIFPVPLHYMRYYEFPISIAR
jgi:hypothetical protein